MIKKVSQIKTNSPKSQKQELKIIVVNKPTKEESAKKIKELSELLSKTHYMSIKSR